MKRIFILLILSWNSVEITLTEKVIDCGDPAPLLNGGVSRLSGELNQYGSVVEYHCDEPYYSLPGAVNVSFICEADGKWRAVNDTDLIPTCLPVCGRPRVDLFGFERIIGGKHAPQGSIPWQVRLSGNGGGMFIADRWILTAAQLLRQENLPLKIFWGTNRIEDNQEPNAISASVHPHPGYNNSDGLHFDYDIALIKLPEPVTFNRFVMPNTLQHGILGVVSGFGILRNDAGNYQLSDNLKYVHLPVVNQSQCSESLNVLRRTMSTPIPKVTPNMFCAGFPDGEKGACAGDSGGPFAIEQRDHFWAAGIVSWGVGCSRRGNYGFYTQVSNYVEWIHKTMKEN